MRSGGPFCESSVGSRIASAYGEKTGGIYRLTWVTLGDPVLGLLRVLGDPVLGLLRMLYHAPPTHAPTTTTTTSKNTFSAMSHTLRPARETARRPLRPKPRAGFAARNHSAPNPYPNRCRVLKNVQSCRRVTPIVNLMRKSNALFRFSAGLVLAGKSDDNLVCPTGAVDGSLAITRYLRAARQRNGLPRPARVHGGFRQELAVIDNGSTPCSLNWSRGARAAPVDPRARV